MVFLLNLQTALPAGGVFLIGDPYVESTSELWSNDTSRDVSGKYFYVFELAPKINYNLKIRKIAPNA